MIEEYDGRQFVGMDLHRRRSVLVRTTESGEQLGWVRIANDPVTLASVMAECGESPQVVLEATYGWYWAADVLAGLGACVHLAHPLGVKGFTYRRVKNDVRDAADLADLLRMGRLPEAWIAPPATRELRELVRHRAKLVHARTSLRCQVHAVLAGQGVRVAVSDLFGVKGRQLLEQLELPEAFRYRVDSLLRLIEVFDREVDQAGQSDRSETAQRSWLRGGADHSRGGTGVGGGVRRRDRRCAPVPWSGAAHVVGGVDPAAS